MTPMSDLLKHSIDEARRFLKAAEAARKRVSESEYMNGSIETAAAKRASMDLTRSLSRLRAGPYA